MPTRWRGVWRENHRCRRRVNIALTIYNRKGFTLPHTGADAPSLWLLIGLPALVAVLLVLVFRYNKKGGRRS